jgi:hypothetical protein
MRSSLILARESGFGGWNSKSPTLSKVRYDMMRVRDGTGSNSITSIGDKNLVEYLRMAAGGSNGEALKYHERKIE